MQDDQLARSYHFVRLFRDVSKLVARGKYDKAKRKLDDAIAESPDDWYPHYLLGWALQSHRNPEYLPFNYMAAHLYAPIGRTESALPLI